MDSLKVEKKEFLFVHWNKQVHFFWSKSILIAVREGFSFKQNTILLMK